MERIRYRLTLVEKGDKNPHFELRGDDTNRPFHVAFRRSQGTIAINSMTDGVWGEEVVTVLRAEDLEKISALYIEIEGTAVRVMAGRDTIDFVLGASPEDVTLRAAAVDMKWETYSESPEIAALRALSGGKFRQVQFLGRTLTLDEDHIPWVANELLVAPALEKARPFLSFLGSHPVSGPGAALTVLDVSERSIANALTAAILLPRASVQVLRRDAERDDFLETLVKANGLSNLQLVDGTPALKDLLGSGHVLVQGDDVFKVLGAEIDALAAGDRAHLSIYAEASEVIPANRVFPCANALIRAGEDLCLRHNSAASRAGRRSGLDVAIAAYNGGDYVMECVRSLLCEGRDDVRVIVVDDGSTDGSCLRVAEAFAGDARVRVERKPNGGCASARNYGRLVSDATHIAFVDADDFVSTNFFADLYDLSLYTGAEVTQGGFDFYDDSRKEPYYPSYERGMFDHYPKTAFKGLSVLRLHSQHIIKGQPTIWRKVYRRDFLDAKNIYFPENIRAYDDYIFQMLTLTAARDVLMIPEHLYHYRQHPAQDIKQGDERHFYMLQMFRSLLRQSLDDSWPNFLPYAQSIMDSIAWSASKLKPELVDSFLVATARLAVAIRKVYGPSVMSDDLLQVVKHPDFMVHFNAEWKRSENLLGGAHWAFSSGAFEHPDLLRMRTALPASK